MKRSVINFFERLFAYLGRVREKNGRVAVFLMSILLLFGLVVVLIAVLALLGLLLWVSPYLGALFVLLLMIVLSV